MTKLNLGCSDNFLEGFVNVDKSRGYAQEIIKGSYEHADLEEGWPWEESSIEFINAADIVEHLKDKTHTMNEAWRVLKSGGRMLVKVPTTDGPGAFQDPTHVTFWNRNTFKYYEHGNIYRDRFAKSYGITAQFKIIEAEIAKTEDGPSLLILLEAVK
jgi:predicted SAM-dependent methyltransferase